jgi:hypothetical protein
VVLVLDRLGSGAADALELLDMVVEEGDEAGLADIGAAAEPGAAGVPAHVLR